MTVEQKAEEWALERTGRKSILWNTLVNAYLAGAKENGVVWHDLRKDPNDLPKEEKQYVVKAKDFDGDITVWICWYWPETKTFTGSYLSEMNVVKWKEIE